MNYNNVLGIVSNSCSPKDLKIHDEDLFFFLPYEEVQLVLKPGGNTDQSIYIMDEPVRAFYR